MVVYADLMALLNAGVDLLLLAGADRLSGFSTDWKRIVPAALLGGLYSGACLLPGFRFLSGMLWRIVSLWLLAGIAFGWNRSAYRRCSLFVLLNMTLGGIAMSIGKSDAISLLLSTAGLWLLCAAAAGNGIGKQQYEQVAITYRGNSVTVIALRDSGNTLLDPVSGESVMVISAESAKSLTGLTQQELSQPLEAISQRPSMGLRLIPFRSVGREAGMMLGMRFGDVRINGKRKSMVVAFAPEGVGRGELHQALMAVG